MRRFLSWVMLIVCYVVFNLLTLLDIALVDYIMILIDRMPLAGQIFVISVGGTTLLGLILAPVFYGPALVMLISEKICESRRITSCR